MSEHGYTKRNSTAKTPDSSGVAWQRPFQSSLTPPIETEADSQPDLQTQLEAAQRMQVNWSQMKVGGTPSVVQTKLKVGAPGDQYEQEADRVAAQVMRMEAPELPREEHTEEEEVQTKPLAETVMPLVQRETESEEENPIQTKPDGFLQCEEDSEEAVQMRSLPIQREEMPEEEESLVQAKANGLLQREALEDEESLQSLPIQRETASIEDEEPVQMQQAESSDEEIQTKRSLTTNLQRSTSSALESQLSQTKGGGSPLSDDVRSFMESRFNTDFSHVRVHTGSSAIQMNQELRSQAFTHGQDIYYGTGKSPGRNDLTAHELTHVVQQTGKVNKFEVQQKCDACSAEEDKLQTKELQEASSISTFKLNAAAKAANLFLVQARHERTYGGSQRDKVNAEQAIQNVDRGKFEAKKSEVLARKQPQIEQTHQYLPQIEKTAQQAAQTQKPSTLSAQTITQEPAKPNRTDTRAIAATDQAAQVADQALAHIDTPQIPTDLPDIVPPDPVAPVTPSGMPVPEDLEGEAVIAQTAQQVQTLRQGGQQLQAHAAEIQGNAQILTGNLQLIKQGVNQADQGVAKSADHLQFRQETLGNAKQALQVSEQKAAKVAAEAPGFTEKANKGQEKSSPMASKASGLAGENAAKTPSDPEAAGKSQEQGQKLNKVASDTTKVDEAFAQTKAKAADLTQEAAQANAKNTQTKSKVQAMEQTLGQTKERLSQMKAQNTQAKTQLQTLENQPEQMAKQSTEMREKGQTSIQSSADLEKQLHQVQAEYQQAINNLPDASSAQNTDAAQTDAGTIQMLPEEGRYEDRKNIDLVGSLSKSAPAWLTGIDPVSEEKRQAAASAAQAKRQQQVAQINTMAGGHFEKLSAGQKMGIAMNLMGQNLSSSLSNIQWPDWKHLALGLIDPRGPLLGVVSGLSQILSGGANLLSAEQWSKDPLGNFLKSAADIATGLTIIFGSITALAGLIIAISSAATILTLGAAAPVTGPIIAFCATVMTTVGGWTFYTGLIAAGLHSLVFIKNLVDAATAKTAEDLQNQSDQMTQDATNAGGALLQAGMGKLAQVGGRQLQSGIAKAGGGVNFARNMGQQSILARGVNAARQGEFGTFARQSLSNAKGGVGALRQEIAEAGGVGGYARRTGKQVWNELTMDTPKEFTGSSAFSRDFLVGEGSVPTGALGKMKEGALQLDLSRKLGGDTVKNLLEKDLDVHDIKRLSQMRTPNGQTLSPEELRNLTQNLDREALLDLVKQDLKIGSNQIRDIYIKKAFPRGNVANVEVSLEDGNWFGTGATSKEQSPVPQPQPRSQGGQFEPTIDSHSGRVMNTDSEYKALSAVAETLDEAGYSSQVRGKIYLYTERAPCESCAGIIEQFKSKYPSIEVEVFSDHPYPP